MARQSTSGSTLSDEIVKVVQTDREAVNRLRFGSIVITVADGVLLGYDVTVKSRRGKEIDYL